MTPPSASIFFFWILALLSIGAAILMVINQNPVRSALFLVLTFLAVAAFYITLSAQFIAAVQIIVYAGAIMVLFLFVIMLLNLGVPGALRERGTLQPVFAVTLALVFIIGLISSKSLINLPDVSAPAGWYEPLGTVEGIGLNLYNPALPWLFPFEITSILLLVAIVGAIVMAKRRV